MFQTPINAVFTRTVADPLGGLKLSGKAGANGLGLFAAYDRTTNLLFPANQGSSSALLVDSTVTTVARYRRDLGQASYVGLLYTGRESFADYHNRVAGVDAFWQLSRSNSLRIQALGSQTAYGDSVAAAFGQPLGEFTGSGISARFLHNSRHWVVDLLYDDLSPEFRADAGFVRRVDQRSVEGAVQRTFWGPRGGWYTQLRAGASGTVTFDYDGTVTDRREGLVFGYLGPSQTSISGGLNQRRTLFGGVTHDLVEASFTFQIRPSGRLLLRLHGGVGDQVDFTNNRKAFSVALVPSAQLSIGRPVTLNLSHVYQRLSFDGTHIFTANLFQARGFYHFSTRMLVRVIVQLQDVRRNPDAYGVLVEEEQRNLFTQFLFSYKLNPQTVAFLGYSDNRVGTSTVDLTQAGRTFFVKLGYALRP